VDTLALVAPMSATKEDIQQENEMYDRLTNKVTEALLALPTKDLNQWNFRAMLFKQCDKIISDVLESGSGRPQISRFYLCLLLYRVVARLLEPIDKEHCGESDRSFARQAMARIETAAARRTSATSNKE
jgi:hypothetical protein